MSGRVVVVWWFCFLACCVCLVGLVVFCFCGGWVVGVVCFTVFPIHSCLRTEAVKAPVCLSEWALDVLWRLMSFVR